MSNINQDGVLIVLAYPEEFVAMVPSWYKKPLEWINMVQDGMICAGHSACILINKNTGLLEYTDFGRYIAPFGKGRARTIETDPDVYFNIGAEFNQEGLIKNLNDILRYIYLNPEKTHGAGTMFASVNYHIDYEKTHGFIKRINQLGSMPYGPFRRDGTNCSRYVKDVILSGLSDNRIRRSLFLVSSLTASPLGNVFFGQDGSGIYRITEENIEVYQRSKLREILRHLFLKKEEAASNVIHEMPEPGFQWLGGTGSGSWFRLEAISNNEFQVTRLHSNGEFVFSKKMELKREGFSFYQPYRFIYDSNAKWCTLAQGPESYIMVS